MMTSVTRNGLMSSMMLAGILSACAPTRYGVQTLSSQGGVQSKQIAAATWQVQASGSWGAQTRGSDMAIYRAAILAGSSGYTHFQTVNFEIKDLIFATNTIRSVKLIAVGTNDPNASFRCEAQPFFARNCKTLNVKDAIRELGPTLGQTPADADREIATVRANGAKMTH